MDIAGMFDGILQRGHAEVEIRKVSARTGESDVVEQGMADADRWTNMKAVHAAIAVFQAARAAGEEPAASPAKGPGKQNGNGRVWRWRMRRGHRSDGCGERVSYPHWAWRKHEHLQSDMAPASGKSGGLSTCAHKM